MLPMLAFALTSTWGGLRAGPLMLCDVFLTLAALMLGIETISTRTPLSVPRWVWVGTVAVITSMSTHVWLPTDPSYIFSRGGPPQANATQVITGLQWLAAFFMLPMLVIFLGRRRERYLGYLMWAWALGAAISALIAGSDMLGVTQIGVNFVEFVNTSGRQNGLQSHANNMGVGCALATPVALYLLGRSRFAGSFLLAALGIGVVASGSRGSQVGYVVAILLSVLLAARDRRTLLRLSSLLVLIVIVMDLPPIKALWLPLMRFGAAGEASDVGRLEYRDQAILDIQTRPIDGIGIDYITSSHSIYLQMLSSGGIILGLGCAAYFGGMLRVAWRLRGPERPHISVLLSSTIIWLGVGIIENQLTDRYLYVPVALIAAYQLVATGGGSGDVVDEHPGEVGGGFVGGDPGRREGQGALRAGVELPPGGNLGVETRVPR
nr:O-antigen ligase family protein [Kineosporia sp. NBRC 101731]